MKKALAILLTILVCCNIASAEPVPSSAVITINGVRTAFFAEDGAYLSPLEEDGIVYVPVEQLAESLDLDVATDAEKLSVTLNGVRTAFFAEDGAYLPPLVVDGILYAPLAAFCESAGIAFLVQDNSFQLSSEEKTAQEPEADESATARVLLTPQNFTQFFRYDVDFSSIQTSTTRKGPLANETTEDELVAIITAAHSYYGNADENYFEDIRILLYMKDVISGFVYTYSTLSLTCYPIRSSLEYDRVHICVDCNIINGINGNLKEPKALGEYVIWSDGDLPLPILTSKRTVSASETITFSEWIPGTGSLKKTKDLNGLALSSLDFMGRIGNLNPEIQNAFLLTPDVDKPQLGKTTISSVEGYVLLPKAEADRFNHTTFQHAIETLKTDRKAGCSILTQLKIAGYEPFSEDKALLLSEYHYDYDAKADMQTYGNALDDEGSVISVEYQQAQALNGQTLQRANRLFDSDPETSMNLVTSLEGIGYEPASEVRSSFESSLSTQYQNASNAVRDRRFEEGIKGFHSISFYQDSEQQRQSAIKAWISDLYTKGQYSEAMKLVKQLPEYEDITLSDDGLLGTRVLRPDSMHLQFDIIMLYPVDKMDPGTVSDEDKKYACIIDCTNLNIAVNVKLPRISSFTFSLNNKSEITYEVVFKAPVLQNGSYSTNYAMSVDNVNVMDIYRVLYPKLPEFQATPTPKKTPSPTPKQTSTPSPVHHVRVTGEGSINVRAQADAKASRVGHAKHGETYEFLETAPNGWYKIRLEDGKEGFISGKMAVIVD